MGQSPIEYIEVYQCIVRFANVCDNGTGIGVLCELVRACDTLVIYIMFYIFLCVCLLVGGCVGFVTCMG